MKISIAGNVDCGVGFSSGCVNCDKFAGAFIPDKRNVVACSSLTNKTNVHSRRSSLIGCQQQDRIFNCGVCGINGCGIALNNKVTSDGEIGPVGQVICNFSCRNTVVLQFYGSINTHICISCNCIRNLIVINTSHSHGSLSSLQFITYLWR